MISLLEAVSPTSRHLLRKCFNSPAMLTAVDQINSRLAENSDRVCATDWSTDYKLAWLIGRTGNIANSMKRHEAVLDVAGCAFAWLESLHIKPMDILVRIADERLRQRKLFTDGIHHFRMDSPVVDWTRKLRVLAEEVGEVAEAIDQLEAKPQSKQAKAHFVTELVQVAAVAVAWLESLQTATMQTTTTTKGK